MEQGKGYVFQIQRWSVHDGRGIRSTVFLKGCPLRCRWCANPESWRGVPEIAHFPERCTRCARCAPVCASGAAVRDEAGGAIFAFEKCSGCGLCAEACPRGARRRIGSVQSVEEIMRTVKRDMIFYRESGGGVTFSGGEPFAQPEFLRGLVSACRDFGLDTGVETCGYFDWDGVKDIVARLDSVFVDVKLMDEEKHRRFTGVGNRRILENVVAISRMRPEAVIRVPLIRGVNDDETNLRDLASFAMNRTRIRTMELLPYHDLGAKKHESRGLVPPRFDPPDQAKISEIKRMLTGLGLSVC
ncbi:glycyl-radical enzyme activating protein [Telmatospirillum siberiense]|uniref:Glycyl-radical enzyme activating protein n=1 Tax=Telmatospirillum siberiense TaxID=382514 RepID=A0A2N3Q1P8_9PROT|nr:glycyl-radical enzyme activating protein [Telmatospirillum siberiense]PKU26573.1 glycyl-radical enzyme activating protein [Telmatospirillum siberiense]